MLAAAEVTIDPGSLLAGLAALVAAIAATVSARSSRKTGAVVNRELTPNGGSSMKDHTSQTVARLAQIESVQGATFDVLDSINTRNHDEHTEIWKRLAEHGIDRRGHNEEDK